MNWLGSYLQSGLLGSLRYRRCITVDETKLSFRVHVYVCSAVDVDSRELPALFCMRNRVERFFRYLKERTVVFHHKMSARDHIQGIKTSDYS